MRTTDPDPKPFRPLGEKVTPKTQGTPPTPQKPEGPSGFVTDENGRLRTTSHKPYAALTLEEAIANWRQHYAEDVDLDFLP